MLILEGLQDDKKWSRGLSRKISIWSNTVEFWEITERQSESYFRFQGGNRKVPGNVSDWRLMERLEYRRRGEKRRDVAVQESKQTDLTQKGFTGHRVREWRKFGKRVSLEGTYEMCWWEIEMQMLKSRGNRNKKRNRKKKFYITIYRIYKEQKITKENEKF